MHLHLQNPYTLLAALLPLILLFFRPKRLVFPSLAALFILLALTSPSLTTSSPPDHLIILLDLSASTRSTPLRNPQWLQKLAQQTLPPQTRLTIVAFAQSQKILLDDISPADSDHWSSTWEPFPNDHPTNLTAALKWRSLNETETNLLPRWLLTDGLTSSIQPSPNMHLAITLVDPKPDLAITDLLYHGSGTLLAHLRSSFLGPQSSVVTLFCNNTNILTQTLALAANEDRWITLHDPTPPTSPALYRLELHAAPTPDLFPENDTASLFYTPPGPPTLLEIKTSVDFPTNLSALFRSGTQAILLPDSVPLTPQNIQILTSFVQDSAGGLLLLGSHFPPQIQSLSPLTADNPIRPSLHIIFLLDASGSMNEPANNETKIRLAAHAIANAAQFLHENDHLTLITFSNTAQLQLDTTAKDFAKSLEKTVLTATGPTNPDSALPLLKNQLANPAEKQILLLLTDGQIPALNVPQWRSLLESTTLLLIAPQPQGGPLKDLLMQPNMHLLATNDPADWQALLQSAITNELQSPVRHNPFNWHTLATPSISGTAHEWVPLYLSANSQPLALGIDENKVEYPFAALAHRGLGHVAALNSDDFSPQLLAYLLTQIASSQADPRFTIAISRMNGGYHVVIDAVENQKFLNTESLKLRILSEQPPKEIPITLTAPGKYELEVQTDSPLSGVVFRVDSDGSEHVVGRVQAAQVETGEWPATVERRTVFPGVDKIGAEQELQGESRYFLSEKRWDLGGFCWGFAGVFLLASLVSRRR